MPNIIESLAFLAVPIDSVKPDPRNARKHPDRNIETIKKSLTAYGQRKPIVVNQDGVIEAGNGLWQAAKALGWQEIAVVKVKDDVRHRDGYSIMDNQSAILADWDLPNLKDMLQELDTGAFDMEATGFSQDEIERLMTQYHPTEADLPNPLDSPEFTGRDGRSKFLLLVYANEVERQKWLNRLGVEGLPSDRRLITWSDVVV